jgi:hypothetical protein
MMPAIPGTGDVDEEMREQGSGTIFCYSGFGRTGLDIRISRINVTPSFKNVHESIF